MQKFLLLVTLVNPLEIQYSGLQIDSVLSPDDSWLPSAELQKLFLDRCQETSWRWQSRSSRPDRQEPRAADKSNLNGHTPAVRSSSHNSVGLGVLIRAQTAELDD